MDNLVFTSAGDNTSFDKLWLDKNRNYKVWVVYYGENEEIYKKYKSKVDYIEKRKGSKFQNFYHIYKNKNLKSFNRFFILDDDIQISTEGINIMFDISKQCNFSICAPSFTPDSKISWEVTINHPGSFLRFTNWVEVNTPLFDKKSLDNLMSVYDESLIGWGIDYLYMWANGLNKRTKYAIIDAVSCRNPHDNEKTEGRELNKIKKYNNRAKIWDNFKIKNNITEVENKKTWWTLSQNQYEVYKRFVYKKKLFFKSFNKNFKNIKSKKDKIAFMFLTTGDLKQPELWYDFFKNNEDRFNIYSHSKSNNIGVNFIKTNQVKEKFETFWGGPGLVLATISMIKEAIKDKTNKYFILLCESSIPIYDFDYVYNKIVNHKKSLINYTKHPDPNYADYIENLLPIDSPIKSVSTCLQWMCLNRYHAQIVNDHGYETFDNSMKYMPVPDEVYFLSLLFNYDKKFIKNNEGLIPILDVENFTKNSPKIKKQVNLNNYKKQKNIHELFLRKVDELTKITKRIK
jgi:hypothetical protein